MYWDLGLQYMNWIGDIIQPITEGINKDQRTPTFKDQEEGKKPAKET